MKKKLKDFRIPTSLTKEHKFLWNFLWLITFILFFPFVIMQILYNLFEVVLNFGISIREKIVHSIFKLLFLKDCKYIGENENA